MEQKLNLPNTENVEFLTRKFIPQEWVTDPPSFVWWRVKEDTIIRVLQTKMKYMAEFAKINARAIELEAKMFEEMTNILK